MSKSDSTLVTPLDCTADKEVAPARDARERVMIFNDSVAAKLYIRFGGSPATAADHSLAIVTQDAYVTDVDYTGPIHAVWSAGDAGKVRVTEFL